MKRTRKEIRFANRISLFNRMLQYTLSLILFLVSLFFSLALSPEKIYLNSDILYLPTLVLDVFRDGGNFFSWSFTPSPYFFPDLPVISVLLLIFENAQKALVAFAFIQTVLFLVLMERFWIFAEEETKQKPLNLKETRRIKSWVLVLVSFILLMTKNFPALYILFLPSIHSSAFLTSLYAWPTIHKTFQKYKVWILYIWIVLTIASDQILIVELIIPGILAGFLQPRFSSTTQTRVDSKWKRFLPESSKILFISGITGLILHRILKSFLFIEKPGRIPIQDSITQAIKDVALFLTRAQTWILSGFQENVPIAAILILILIISLIVGFIKIRKTKTNSFLFFFLAILFFSPILTGSYIDEYSLRYATPSLILAPFFLAFLAGFPKRALTLLIFIIFLCIIGQKKITNVENAFFKLFRTIPQEASCMDEITRKTSISLVISDFWTAKKIRTFSKEKIQSVHVSYGTLEGSHTISNREWYFKDSPGIIAVFTEGLGENRILEIYGTPFYITKCGERKLYLYKDRQKIKEALRRPFLENKIEKRL
ncbi:putative membrane protein [Leptospira kirschneri serovar Bulgarica str. Nikolaevo]|uniref:Putative membrane protein n=3 Tax=Leptospira kirschneri TaxID=29507 RepID=A0A0E2B3D3_9LEPT|nr:putative membrane protein [Leptospira kirschneri str. H1]EMK24582.1 putative membrane protein [Leptospira kirschneri serovar Bulgarica str. Nikolaevo]